MINPPHLLLALDSFKGTASSTQAAGLLAEGINEVLPEATLTIRAMADGGEGTSAIFPGQRITIPTTDAAGRLTQATYTFSAELATAYIDIAAASGLPAVTDNLVATTGDTYGTGVLIADAISRGAQKIFLGLGGSATTDGGSGILIALGAVLRNRSGYPLQPGGAELLYLEHIDTAELSIPAAAAEWVLLTDVRSPATGPTGAAQVFGPQKGASTEEVKLLDVALTHFSQTLDVDGSIPGMGAAGGTAIGISWLSRFVQENNDHWHLVSGAGVTAKVNGLAELLPSVDMVITGEGAVDSQSFNGKVVGTVYELAKAANTPVTVLSGSFSNSLPADISVLELMHTTDIGEQFRTAGIKLAQSLISKK